MVPVGFKSSPQISFHGSILQKIRNEFVFFSSKTIDSAKCKHLFGVLRPRPPRQRQVKSFGIQFRCIFRARICQMNIFPANAPMIKHRNPSVFIQSKATQSYALFATSLVFAQDRELFRNNILHRVIPGRCQGNTSLHRVAAPCSNNENSTPRSVPPLFAHFLFGASQT